MDAYRKFAIHVNLRLGCTFVIWSLDFGLVIYVLCAYTQGFKLFQVYFKFLKMFQWFTKDWTRYFSFSLYLDRTVDTTNY